jgi:hypothetical protein
VEVEVEGSQLPHLDRSILVRNGAGWRGGRLVSSPRNRSSRSVRDQWARRGSGNVGFVAGVGLLSRLPKTPESFAPSGRPSTHAQSVHMHGANCDFAYHLLQVRLDGVF